MDKPTAFIDSDVIISSLISSTGASYYLLHHTSAMAYISSVSLKELHTVVERLRLDTLNLEAVIKNRLSIISIPYTTKEIKKIYIDYVRDSNDAHVLAGAVSSKARFLITYNIRDFHVEKIKQKFNILVIKPSYFLQYLRSRK